MKSEKLFSKKTMHTYIISLFIVCVIITVALLMLKYHVEGETNLPFNLKQISIISTAQSSLKKGEDGLWYSDISQKNDIYFYIEKNGNYKKEEIIKNITFENFVITKQNEEASGDINIYKPSENGNIYIYEEEYIVNGELKYIGAQFTDTGVLEINNQGGLIGFSILNSNIGKYSFNENEIIPSDGTLLSKASIDLDNIIFKVSFDIIIETVTEKKFKANIEITLPEGNIVEEGVSSREYSEPSDIVFKRF